MKKNKLCYVLPDYESSDISRYFYIVEFIESLSKDLDLFLFVETPSTRKEKFTFPVYYQKFKTAPMNLIERVIVFLYLRTRGYDNFYIHYSIFSSIIAAIISRLTNGRSFYWFCQMRRLYDHFWWEELAYKLNLWLTTFLITCNKGMVEYFEKNYGVVKSKIKVIPLWINCKRFASFTEKRTAIRREFGLKNEKVILFVHWLSVRKGADKILPVLRMITRKVPNVKFFVVGDGPLLQTLKQDVLESGLSNKITFFGHIGNRKIPRFYAASDVFFMPSKEEEFGRVLLEAMAAGLPIVATKTVGPNDIMLPSQRELLVEVENTDNFSDKIIELLKDEVLYQKLQRDGYEVVNRYDIKKISSIFSLITKR